MLRVWLRVFLQGFFNIFEPDRFYLKKLTLTQKNQKLHYAFIISWYWMLRLQGSCDRARLVMWARFGDELGLKRSPKAMAVSGSSGKFEEIVEGLWSFSERSRKIDSDAMVE